MQVQDKFSRVTFPYFVSFTAFSVIVLFSSKGLNNPAWFVASYLLCLRSVFYVGQNFIFFPFWNRFPLCVYTVVTITVFKILNGVFCDVLCHLLTEGMFQVDQLR